MKKAMKNTEVKDFLELVEKQYSISLAKKDRYKKDDTKILINNKAMFFYHEDKLIPTLHFLNEHDVLKKVTVDMGAVPYAVKGVDMMRPGIKNIEPGFEKGDGVVIIDEKHGKKIAVGQALFSSSEMQSMTSGKVVKNLHWVGDGVWGIS